jgi:hypothetical protein
MGTGESRLWLPPGKMTESLGSWVHGNRAGGPIFLELSDEHCGTHSGFEISRKLGLQSGKVEVGGASQASNER